MSSEMKGLVSHECSGGALEKELIIKPLAPPQWAWLARVLRADPVPHPPVLLGGLRPTREDCRKLGPQGLNNKAFWWWELPGQEMSEAD